MTWHWSYRTLPGLAGLPDDEQQRVWDLARKRARWRPAAWLPVVAASAALLVTVPRVVDLCLAGGLWATFVLGPLAGGAIGISLFALAAQAGYQVARPYILRELPGRCRGCGYDLTGNASGACPECGRVAGASA